MVRDREDTIFLLERKKVLDVVRKWPGMNVTWITSKIAQDAFAHRRLLPGVRRHLNDLEEDRKVFQNRDDTWWPK